MKFLFSHNDKKTEFKADYGQILNYFKNTPREEIIASFDNNQNKKMINSQCLNDNISFKGGRYDDMFKDVLIDTKKELDVKPVQNFVNKRKRFLSEHDGDYVHDRRYDINFMESARREKVQGSNLIKINACGTFSARIESYQIDAYAKEICELVNYFEAQGRSVELNMIYKSNRNFSGAPLIKTFVTVKQPDKYLSKSDIYRAFSSIFFRHIGFCTIVATADFNKKEVDHALGVPLVLENKIDITETEINIHGLTKDLVKRVQNETKL